MDRYLKLVLPTTVVLAVLWIGASYLFGFGLVTVLIGAVCVGLICGGLASV